MTAHSYIATARSGAGSGNESKPLAGSQHIWFDQVRQFGSAEPLPVSTLEPGIKNRLSALRRSICGLRMDRPQIMGILNVTPDSFSDGGKFHGPAAALAGARALAKDADILDIGGESTRPGAQTVPEADEIARIVPVIEALRAGGVTLPISVDTRKAAVAAAALDAGANMVNDVSALSYDSAMAGLLAERGVPVCLMHAVGTPETMQAHAHYDNVITEVFQYLADRIAFATAAGIDRQNIITDPGIGFAKTLEHNISLLQNLSYFHDLGCPILLGASRKKFIGTIGGAQTAAERLGGSLAVALHGAAHGVQMLRVHDTFATKQALRLQQELIGQS